MALAIEGQCIVLHNMLLYFGMGDGKADLTLIGGSPNSGILKFTGTIDDADSLLIIYSKSPTGLFGREEQIEI